MPLSSSHSHLVSPRAMLLGIVGLAVAMLASLALALAPAPAAASANGCVQSSFLPNSCVRVTGSGTWVESMGGGVRLGVRQSVNGYHLVTAGGYRYQSTVRTYWNQSYWHHQTYYSDYAVRAYLPRGTRVCAQFIENRSGRWFAHSAACKTVEG